MKNWRITFIVHSLTGQEEKSLEVKAKTKESAEKKGIKIMGNRDFEIIEIVEWDKK